MAPAAKTPGKKASAKKTPAKKTPAKINEENEAIKEEPQVKTPMKTRGRPRKLFDDTEPKEDSTEPSNRKRSRSYHPDGADGKTPEKKRFRSRTPSKNVHFVLPSPTSSYPSTSQHQSQAVYVQASNPSPYQQQVVHVQPSHPSSYQPKPGESNLHHHASPIASGGNVYHSSPTTSSYQVTYSSPITIAEPNQFQQQHEAPRYVQLAYTSMPPASQALQYYPQSYASPYQRQVVYVQPSTPPPYQQQVVYVQPPPQPSSLQPQSGELVLFEEVAVENVTPSFSSNLVEPEKSQSTSKEPATGKFSTLVNVKDSCGIM